MHLDVSYVPVENPPPNPFNPGVHNPVAIPAAMATVVAAMAALAAAVTATLAALHLENSSSHHSTDPRTAENASPL